MKNHDYLIMCSKCEVRIHPDDYEKHKAKCESPVYPIYPVYPTPYYPPYPFWEWRPYEGPTYTGTATDKVIIGDFPETSVTSGNSSCNAGVTLTS